MEPDRPLEFEAWLASSLRRLAPGLPAVSEARLGQLVAYLRILERWNRTINLTSLNLVSMPDESLMRLIVEPLVAAQLSSPSGGVWFDLGSGNGSPAIPMKVVRPEFSLTMVESRTRKVAFLREAAREASLDHVRVVCGRIEQVVAAIPPHQLSLVTMRGVRPTAAILSTVRRALSSSGELVTFGDDDRRFGNDFSVARSEGEVTVLKPVFHVEHDQA